MEESVKKIKDEKTIAVDPRKEYIAGGALYSSYADGARTLSNFDSNGSLKYHSAQTFEQMCLDPKIAKAINILKISTLGDGVEFLPAVAENDENYEYAVTIANFCDKAVRELELPLRYVLEQMMDALVYGHKVGEITYKTSALLGFEGNYLVPAKIKVKKLDAVRFVVDNKANILGLVAKNPTTLVTQNASLTTRNGRKLIDGQPILPREKFLVLTIRGKDSDPRGQSILAPAFNAWHLKTQIWPEYLRYLLLCAIPILVGTTPDNESGIKELLRGEDGQPIKDPSTGAFIEANPVEALRDALLNARNAEVLAAKGGTKITEIGAHGAGTPFFKAIELFDSQMETAILLQTLATSEGIHQNRAASTMHMSILDQLVWWLKGVVVDMLVADLLRPMVRMNFGERALEFVPNITLGDTERREFAADAQAVATLYKAGYFQPEQLKKLDAMLGIGIRETVDPLQMIQQLQSSGIPVVAVPPPPAYQAEIQAGPGGGTRPVPVAPSAVPIPIGSSSDSAQQTSRSSTLQGSDIKNPAIGRGKGKINRTPQNAELPDTV